MSSGVKSLLDVEATAEMLETLGVPVLGWRTDTMPRFYDADGGPPVTDRVESAEEAVRLARLHWELGGCGVLVARPPDTSIDVDDLIDEALEEAERQGIARPGGDAVRPLAAPRAERRPDARGQQGARRRQRGARRRARGESGMSRELRFDFPGLRVGIAEYEDGPTGCTVFHLPPGGAACSVDIRGGSPGTIGNYEWAHAVCFAGGSLYGLEAACGVAAELMVMRGNTVGWEDVELVLGAIVYDFGRRDNAIYPDAELGRQALRAAQEGVFPLGRRGAGRSVTVGKTFGSRAGRVLGPGRRVPRGRPDEGRRSSRS